MKKDNNVLKNVTQSIGNLIISIFAGISCMYVIAQAEMLSIESVIKGMMTAGAVLCLGYLGKLRLIGGNKGKEQGKKLFPILLIAFIVFFLIAII